MFFQLLIGVLKLLIGGRDIRGQRGNRQRRSDTGDDIFTLGIHQTFAEECMFAGIRISSKSHTGSARVAHVAEHHRNDIDRSPPMIGNPVEAPIGNRPCAVPGREHGVDRHFQLFIRIVREIFPGFLFHQRLESPDEIPQRPRVQLCLVRDTHFLFLMVQNRFEMLARDAHDDAAEHRDEATITILGKSLVLRLRGQSFHRLQGKAHVEYRIHHAWHRGSCAGSYRHQQRLLGITELHPHGPFDTLQRGQCRIPHPRRILLPLLVVFDASFRRDRKARGDGNTEVRHLGQPRTFSTEQLLHVGGTLGFSVSEIVDVFFCHVTSPSDRILNKSASNVPRLAEAA